MRVLRGFRLGALLAMASLAGAPLLAQQQSQDSVAEAARKARQKKKPPEKPAKVYTDEDLSRIPPSGAPQVQVVGTAPAEESATSTEGKPKEGKQGQDATAEKPAEEQSGEKLWRRRFKELYEARTRAQRELDVLQREFDRGQVQYYSDPTKAMNEQLNRKELTDKQSKIAAKQKEIDNLNQRISDLEDELRKAGGDPGWARP